MNITLIHRELPDIEETHQVHILSVQVAKDLQWWPDVLYYDRLRAENQSALIGQLNDVLALARKLTTRLKFLTLLWLQQRL